MGQVSSIWNSLFDKRRWPIIFFIWPNPRNKGTSNITSLGNSDPILEPFRDFKEAEFHLLGFDQMKNIMAISFYMPNRTFSIMLLVIYPFSYSQYSTFYRHSNKFCGISKKSKIAFWVRSLYIKRANNCDSTVYFATLTFALWPPFTKKPIGCPSKLPCFIWNCTLTWKSQCIKGYVDRGSKWNYRVTPFVIKTRYILNCVFSRHWF